MFTSLRLFNYRVWFFGALVANIGTWMQRVAQDWLVLAVLPEGSAVHVGIVTGLQFLPVIFLSPLAGLIADRVDRRKMLITTQAGMGLLALALGALVLLGTATVYHVYLFALALGIFSAFDAPVRQVFVSDIVPPASLANAVALNSASFNAARLVGPGVAGLLIAAVGPGWAFIVNAITFAATIGAVLAMRVGQMQPREPTKRGKGQLREGVAYVRGRADIITIMIVVFLVGGLGLKFQLTSAAMAHDEFGMGAGEYGVLGSVLAIGSLFGALMAARRKRPRLRLVLGAAFGFGVSSLIMAMTPTYELFAISAIPVGFFSLTMLTSANAAIQTTTEPNIRGRVMSLYLVVFFAGNPVGGPIVGWIAETFGARWSIAVGAITAILVATIAAAVTARREEVRVRYRLRQRPHLVLQHRNGKLESEAAGDPESASTTDPASSRQPAGARKPASGPGAPGGSSTTTASASSTGAASNGVASTRGAEPSSPNALAAAGKRDSESGYGSRGGDDHAQTRADTETREDAGSRSGTNAAPAEKAPSSTPAASSSDVTPSGPREKATKAKQGVKASAA